MGFFGEPLGSTDNPTWANFGKQNWRRHRACSVLCVSALCVVCVVGVQCVGVGVCVGVCVCVLVLVLVCHADPSFLLPPLSQCVHPKRPPSVHSKCPVYTGTTPASVNHVRRGSGGTHGDVLNVHTGVFNGHTTTQQHTTTSHGDRDRKRKRDKTRQDKKAREKEERDTRKEKREERRLKREDENEERYR